MIGDASGAGAPGATRRRSPTAAAVEESDPPVGVQAGAPDRGRGFWSALAFGWTAYMGVVAFGAAAEGEALPIALPAAVVTTLPAALLSVLVALRSRELFRPDRAILVTLALNLGVGVLYAVLNAALIAGLVAVTRPLVAWPEHEMTPPMLFAIRSVGGFLLYALLAAFLAWTESLRNVQETRAMAAREAMLRAQAELRAIRAQFNPHFVFNTLHSMLLLVRADPPAAERAIEDVAGLIRYADRLRRQDVDVVPLEREVEFCRRYLALEALRLEDRLRVEWTLEEEALHLGVPAFALQTLLENAVQHAAAVRREGATVRVTARTDGDGLALEVTDDGPGASPEALRPREGRGLGLLAQRVAALYGADGSLDVSARPGGGIRALLRVPAGSVAADRDIHGAPFEGP